MAHKMGYSNKVSKLRWNIKSLGARLATPSPLSGMTKFIG